MDTIQAILNAMMREAISPQTAAVAIAVIGLNIHFGFTGLLNIGQSGFMLLGAYGFAISIGHGLPLVVGVLVGFARGAGLRAGARRADPEAARRLPGDRDDLRGGDHQVRRQLGAADRLHRRRPGPPGRDLPRARSRTCRSSVTATPR